MMFEQWWEKKYNIYCDYKGIGRWRRELANYAVRVCKIGSYVL